MISAWMVNFLGTFGTAALLLVVGISYLIWQFNPTFNLPQRKPKPVPVINEDIDEVEENLISGNGATINDLYGDKNKPGSEKKNSLKGDGGMLVNINGDMEGDIGLTILEKDEENIIGGSDPIVEKEIVNDLLH